MGRARKTRGKKRIRIPKLSMNIARFEDHAVDETLERRLENLGKEFWWSGFIQHINKKYAELSNFYQPPPSATELADQEAERSGRESPGSRPSSSGLCGPFQSRNLHWAITTTAQMLSTNELPKRLQVLSYIVDDDEGVHNLIYLLEDTVLAAPLSLQLSYILRETVSSRNGLWCAPLGSEIGQPAVCPSRARAIHYLTTYDALYRVLNLLSALQNEIQRSKDKDAILEHRMSTVNLIWILSAMAAKDSKFGLNLKSLGRVKFVHVLIRDNLCALSGDCHLPFLKVFRTMCKSAAVGAILRGDNIFLTLKRLFDMYNYQPSIRFQHVLDILMILTKSAAKPKIHSKKFLKSGLLISLMRAFNYWPMWKGKGLLKLSRTTLMVYSNLALTACGRRALLNTDALVNVRRFCESCPNDKHFDDVVIKSYAMVALANGRHKLPFKELVSPIKFEVPGRKDVSLENSKESGTSSDEDDPDEPEQINPSDDENSDDSEVEQEQDAGEDGSQTEIIEEDSEDDEPLPDPRGALRKSSVTTSNNSSSLASTSNPSTVDSVGALTQETSREELAGFAHFFKELDGFLGEKGFAFGDVERNSTFLDLLDGKMTLDCDGEAAIPKELKYLWVVERPEYGTPHPVIDLRKVFLTFSRRTRSVAPFVKIAYPDFALAYNGKRSEHTIHSADRFTLRSKVLTQMGRAAGAEVFKPKVIYDLDLLLSSPQAGITAKSVNRSNPAPPPPQKLGNTDEADAGSFDKKRDNLYFESRFESGNLRKAIQVSEKEYDLYLTSDVNSAGHNQWFYFQISNIQEGSVYTFNIVNCCKNSSQFNFGMQPVVFSVMDAMEGKPGWVRSGSSVIYHKNGYRSGGKVTKKSKCYHSASFSIAFQRRGDICYIAYHFPYTYSRLLTELWKMKKAAVMNNKVYVRYDVLCNSINKNEVPLVTITAPNDPFHPIELRSVIVFTARVHPGEPNASWMMHGILHKLLFGDNTEILQRFVFKIVPMLNVEGVINGCHRCGLTNEDLNRRWKNPNPVLHPSIYNTKALIEYCCRIRNKIPVMYCDLHGHSRRKNVFLYGCSRPLSWSPMDRAKPEDPNILNALAEAMARRSPFFAISYCNYDVRKSRESTARVALWREFGITRSYTLESSYCGFDRGSYKGISLGIHHLIEVGESLCESCQEFYKRPVNSASLYSIPTGPIDSKVNHANLEEGSGNESDSSSSSSTSDDEEWNETSLNPVID